MTCIFFNLKFMLYLLYGGLMKKNSKNDLIDDATKQLDSWKKEHDEFLIQHRFIDYQELYNWKNKNAFPNKTSIGFTLNINIIRKYNNYKKHYNELKRISNLLKDNIESHNKMIASEKMGVFRNICGKIEDRELDDNQIDAIVRENRNQLVLAGAGSGKTTTIIGKVKYLIKTNFAKPNEILILSFTDASVKEMEERVSKEIGQDIEVYTFHKLGLKIIERITNKKPKIYRGELRNFVKEQLLFQIKNNVYLNNIIRFISNGKYGNKESFDFKTQEEYEEYLTINPPTTLQGEVVKSYGEMEIANYLYTNNIKYKYEDRYKYDTTTNDHQQYHPDFYLVDYDIYIEYYGIDENLKVAPYFKGKDGVPASKLYNDSIEWKRQTHKKYNQKYIECYYYEKKNNKLIENLEKNLIKEKVNINPKSCEEIWQDINNRNNGIIDEITKTFETVINLLKNNNYTIEYFIEIMKNKSNYNNNLLIINLIRPIYEAYQNELNKYGEIDFNDMINLSTYYVQQTEYKHNYKYVIVDEYQDISKSRFNLLFELRKQADYKLFCVGDDWQSIYRFNGSDINLITHFVNYWGETYTSKIENTYRFSNELAKLSGSFIMKNPNQIKKSINGYIGNTFPVAIINGYTEKNCVDFLEEKLLNFEKNSTVYFIGRYAFDVNILKCNSNYQLRYNNVKKYTEIIYLKRKDLKIIFLTAHKSKGLQADYVVILNNKNTGMGFPSKINDLPIINLLLENNDEYANSEERRLFYVAITRSKKKTYLLTIDKNKSSFIKELEKDYGNNLKEKYIKKCPNCNGNLVIKSGKYGNFFGCTNYPNCTYTKNL